MKTAIFGCSVSIFALLCTSATASARTTSDQYVFTSESFDQAGVSDRQQGGFTQETAERDGARHYRIKPRWMLSRQTLAGQYRLKVATFKQSASFQLTRDNLTKAMASDQLSKPQLTVLNSGLTPAFDAKAQLYRLPLPTKLGVLTFDDPPAILVKRDAHADGGDIISYRGTSVLTASHGLRIGVTFNGVGATQNHFAQLEHSSSWVALDTPDCGRIVSYTSIVNATSARRISSRSDLNPARPQQTCDILSRAYYFAVAKNLNMTASAYAFGVGEHDTNELPLASVLAMLMQSVPDAAPGIPPSSNTPAAPDTPPPGTTLTNNPACATSACDTRIYIATDAGIVAQDVMKIDGLTNKINQLGLSDHGSVSDFLTSAQKLYDLLNRDIAESINPGSANIADALGANREQSALNHGWTPESAKAFGDAIRNQSTNIGEVVGIDIAFIAAMSGNAEDLALLATEYGSKITADYALESSYVGKLQAAEALYAVADTLEAKDKAESLIKLANVGIESAKRTQSADIASLGDQVSERVQADIDTDTKRYDDSYANAGAANINDLFNQRDAQIEQAETLYKSLTSMGADQTSGLASTLGGYQPTFADGSNPTGIPGCSTGVTANPDCAAASPTVRNVSDYISDPMSLYTGGYADATVIGLPYLVSCGSPCGTPSTISPLPPLSPIPSTPSSIQVVVENRTTAPKILTPATYNLVYHPDPTVQAAYAAAYSNYLSLFNGGQAPVSTYHSVYTADYDKPYAVYLGSVNALSTDNTGRTVMTLASIKSGVYDVYGNGGGVIIANTTDGSFLYSNPLKSYPVLTSTRSSNVVGQGYVTIQYYDGSGTTYRFTQTAYDSDEESLTETTDNGPITLLGRVRILPASKVTPGLSRSARGILITGPAILPPPKGPGG